MSAPRTALDPMPPADTSRMVAYASEGITDPDHPDRHMVAYVIPGEPGYYGTTYTGTLDYCRTVAASINETLGRSEDDVHAAVASSIAAQNGATRPWWSTADR